ncbi:MAG: hypothetical protein ACM3PZ_03395 [Bacillota bacterium]
MDKAENEVRFNLELILIPPYRRVIQELIEATDGFCKEGSVLVSLDVFDLAEALELADEDSQGTSGSGLMSFFRHIQMMIDVGYRGQGGEIFSQRGLRLYLKDFHRLGLESES